MHISQQWHLVVEAKYDYIMQAEYLHCRELSWPAPCSQTPPSAQVPFSVRFVWCRFLLCAAVASRGWKIPGDLHGEPPTLRCGLKEELKGAATANGYRLNVGGPHDIVRVVTLAHGGFQVPMFLEMASPREHARPADSSPARLVPTSLPSSNCFSTLQLLLRLVAVLHPRWGSAGP